METYLDPLMRLDTEQFVALGAGLALLIFGRRLYWLAVGALGAVVAVLLADQLGQGLDPQLRLIVGGIACVLGALFAVAAQKTALLFAGVVLGGLTFGAASYVVLTDFLHQDPSGWPFVAGAFGAFFGLLFARTLFDGALIIVSSAVGALLLIRVLSAAWALVPTYEALGALGLFALGLAAQTGRKRKPRLDDD